MNVWIAVNADPSHGIQSIIGVYASERLARNEAKFADDDGRWMGPFPVVREPNDVNRSPLPFITEDS